LDTDRQLLRPLDPRWNWPRFRDNEWYRYRGQVRSIGVSRIRTLPVLDVAALSGDQLAAAVKVFQDMKSRELRPVNEISADPVRQELDERFAIEVLCLPTTYAASEGPLALLRAKLALEPSITGAKSI